jgi:hypothetical protein
LTITQRTAAAKRGIRIKSRIKAGENLEKLASNHSQTAKGIRVKSRIKAGLNFTNIKVEYKPQSSNHNQTARGIRIKSRIKAGLCPGDGTSGGGTTPTGK